MASIKACMTDYILQDSRFQDPARWVDNIRHFALGIERLSLGLLHALDGTQSVEL